MPRLLVVLRLLLSEEEIIKSCLQPVAMRAAFYVHGFKNHEAVIRLSRVIVLRRRAFFARYHHTDRQSALVVTEIPRHGLLIANQANRNDRGLLFCRPEGMAID